MLYIIYSVPKKNTLDSNQFSYNTQMIDTLTLQNTLSTSLWRSTVNYHIIHYTLINIKINRKCKFLQGGVYTLDINIKIDV